MGEKQILIVNSGSSSLKLSIASLPPYQIFASLVAERLRTENAVLRMEEPHDIQQTLLPNATHRTALEACLSLCQQQGSAGPRTGWGGSPGGSRRGDLHPINHRHGCCH